jgi:hypothetical protein
VVSVQYATIVRMTDADIARDNVSRDAYVAVAARRTQFDQLVWQVSLLGRSSFRLRSHLTERERPGSSHHCSRS